MQSRISRAGRNLGGFKQVGSCHNPYTFYRCNNIRLDLGLVADCVVQHPARATIRDSEVRRNYEEAKVHGLTVGLYHYCRRPRTGVGDRRDNQRNTSLLGENSMEAIDFMPGMTTMLAEDQEEYFALPVIKVVYNDGTRAFVSAWIGNWRERLRFLMGKPIYLAVMTVEQHPPVLLTTNENDELGLGELSKEIPDDIRETL